MRFQSLQFWTAKQGKALAVVVLVLIGVMVVRLWDNPQQLDDPQPPVGARANELIGRIDPNTADAAALAALPLIGEKRAADIIAHREKFLREHDGATAFAALEDLMNVKGIGKSTIATLEPYLIFPAEKSAVEKPRMP